MSKSVKSGVIQKNLKLHEEEAENYEDEKTEIYNKKEQNRIKSALSEAKKHIDTGNSELKALDVGCGTGNILKKLGQQFHEVVGVDLSDDMLSVASSKLENKESLEFVRGRAASLPFQDENFDLVSAYSVLHHLPNFSDPLSEITRVLKEGGVVYIDHEPIERENFLVKSYLKVCDILNGEDQEGLPPYNEKEGREYCDYHIHHGENSGVPTSKIIDLCKDEGLEIINSRKYLSYGTEEENPLYPLLKRVVNSEWLLMGKKQSK